MNKKPKKEIKKAAALNQEPAPTNEEADKIKELTNDLQRLRADFENYRKRVEQDKQTARGFAKQETVLKLLPALDNINRATSHLPASLEDNQWASGVVKLPKILQKDLAAIGVSPILAAPGTPFNPQLHDAIQMDEAAEGETEVVAEELQTGYMVDGVVIRPAMVKVTRN